MIENKTAEQKLKEEVGKFTWFLFSPSQKQTLLRLDRANKMLQILADQKSSK